MAASTKAAGFVGNAPYRGGGTRRPFHASLITGAKVCAYILLAPLTAPWLIYGAWIMCRDIDRALNEQVGV